MRAFSLGILLLLAESAWACGHCVEDKIAAVYDHGAITRALGAGRTVVFFAVEGALKPGQPTRLKIEKTAAAVAGVEPGSVRLSVELGSLALAFDPRRATLAQVQSGIERKLRPLAVSLLPMQVWDRPADLAAAGRR